MTTLLALFTTMLTMWYIFLEIILRIKEAIMEHTVNDTHLLSRDWHFSMFMCFTIPAILFLSTILPTLFAKTVKSKWKKPSPKGKVI